MPVQAVDDKLVRSRQKVVAYLQEWLTKTSPKVAVPNEVLHRLWIILNTHPDATVPNWHKIVAQTIYEYLRAFYEGARDIPVTARNEIERLLMEA
jgi:hypothetical protein